MVKFKATEDHHIDFRSEKEVTRHNWMDASLSPREQSSSLRETETWGDAKSMENDGEGNFAEGSITQDKTEKEQAASSNHPYQGILSDSTLGAEVDNVGDTSAEDYEPRSPHTFSNGHIFEEINGEENGKENGKENEGSEEENEDKEDEDEDEEEDDDDDDDDEPPLLKYSRLNQLAPNFFKKDPVSIATFGEKVFVFGTHTGHILLTNPDFTPIRSFKAHKASILSLFTDGQFFASGSMDGTIVIGSVVDSKDIIMLDYKRPIHAVILDKNYQRTRSFICGGMAGLVIYSSKNWLDQRVDSFLDKDNGPIIAIHMVDDLVFWMNDRGITVYHTASRSVVSVIPKPSDSFRSDLYWPRISFPEIDRVLIGWGNYIWALRLHGKGNNGSVPGAGSSIKSRILPSAASLSFRSAPERKVEVEHVFKVDYLIAGIAGFNDDQWVVLAYNQPEKDEFTGQMVSQCPDLKILNSADGSTIFEEELALNGIDNLGLNDYNMYSHIGPSLTRYMILSARDGIVAQQVQLDDRLDWLLDRCLFAEAWRMSQHLVTARKRLDFGLQHLDSLVKDSHWTQAANWLSEILAVDTAVLPVGDTRSTLATRYSRNSQVDETDTLIKEVVTQWNSWADIFIKSGHVRELTEVIPTDPRWNLSKSIFTSVLSFWLQTCDVDDQFYLLINQWDLELYDVTSLTSIIEHTLEVRPQDKRLRKQLCDIYEKSLEPAKAVAHLETLKNPRIVEFLHKFHILGLFSSELPRHLKLRFPKESDIETLPIPEVEDNLRPVIEILVEGRFEITPRTMFDLMMKNRLEVVSFMYLEKLASIDEILVRGFGGERLKLLGQFARSKLLPFLKSDNNYKIREAIETCEANGFVDELIYLLGKVGESQKAMSLILQNLDDPARAINFAKSRNDATTWKMLLDHSFSKPHFIKSLLELADDQSSKFYDPMTILSNIQTDVHIEGLKDSITKVYEDHDMNVIVHQLLLNIVYKRSEEISLRYKNDRLRGFLLTKEDVDFQELTDALETIVISQNPQNPSKPKVELLSNFLHEDVQSFTLFTTMEDKLKHLQQIQIRYQQKNETKPSSP